MHSASCPNVTNLMYDPERRIDVEWDTGDDQRAYTVRLSMQVEDRQGMLAAISARSRPSTPTSGRWRRRRRQEQGFIEMTVEIQDMKHLDKVISA